MLTRQHGAELGGAMATQRLRQLAERLVSPGGAGSIMEELGGLGVTPGAGFAERIRGLGARAIDLGEREAGFERDQAIEQQRREREDINEQIDEARRRMAELDERQAELIAGYKDTVKTMRDDFSKAVRDGADGMRDLNHEIGQLLTSRRTNKVDVRSDLMGTLQGAARSSVLVPAQQQAPAAMTPVQLIINGLEVQLSEKGQKSLQELTQELTDLSRRTAPSRK
jgi:hypothetical protein